MDDMNKMLITFCVIAYNEEENIGYLFKNLCEQTYDHKWIDVVFVDGGSTDRTKELMNQFKDEHAEEFYQIQVLDNPGKTLPCGWNVALAHYQGEAIVRVDAHARIEKNFIERNVYRLSKGEYVCGGFRPNIFDEDTPWKRTLLAAESSLFGASIADFRRNGQDRKVDSVFHGAYKREVFDKVGTFNEKLVRTEDNDMNYRIREAGYDIWFHPDIVSYQHIRESLGKMLRQKYLNGFWIARTLKINPSCLSKFYFVPFLFVLGIIFTTILALLGKPELAIIMWGMYLLFGIVNTLLAMLQDKHRSMLFLALPVIFLLLHVSYGLGTAHGLISLIYKKG